MVTTRTRRVGRLLAVGLVIATVAKALGRARSRSGGAGSLTVTSADTWPPVPNNPDRN